MDFDPRRPNLVCRSCANSTLPNLVRPQASIAWRTCLVRDPPHFGEQNVRLSVITTITTPTETNMGTNKNPDSRHATDVDDNSSVNRAGEAAPDQLEDLGGDTDKDPDITGKS